VPTAQLWRRGSLLNDLRSFICRHILRSHSSKRPRKTSSFERTGCTNTCLRVCRRACVRDASRHVIDTSGALFNFWEARLPCHRGSGQATAAAPSSIFLRSASCRPGAPQRLSSLTTFPQTFGLIAPRRPKAVLLLIPKPTDLPHSPASTHEAKFHWLGVTRRRAFDATSSELTCIGQSAGPAVSRIWRRMRPEGARLSQPHRSATSSFA
jgi:hypothetical protein